MKKAIRLYIAAVVTYVFCWLGVVFIGGSIWGLTIGAENFKPFHSIVANALGVLAGIASVGALYKKEYQKKKGDE